MDRVHLTSPFAVQEATEEHEATLELAGSTWTQRAEELQGIVRGVVKLRGASAHECPAVRLRVWPDGSEIGGVGMDLKADQTKSTYLTWGQYVEPTELPTKAV